MAECDVPIYFSESGNIPELSWELSSGEGVLSRPCNGKERIAMEEVPHTVDHLLLLIVVGNSGSVFYCTAGWLCRYSSMLSASTN